MLSNIFQETVPDSLIDISFSTAAPRQPTYLTAASVPSVYTAVSSAYASQAASFPAVGAEEGFVESELSAVPEISCHNLQPAAGDLEIPLFTVPSLDIRRAIDVINRFSAVIGG
jgi:hypothetical protein